VARQTTIVGAGVVAVDAVAPAVVAAAEAKFKLSDQER
jgi:hypothetical protein